MGVCSTAATKLPDWPGRYCKKERSFLLVSLLIPVWLFSWEILQCAAVNEFENRNANNGHLIICMTCM